MEYKVTCNLTLHDGSQVTQSFDVPPDPQKVQVAVNHLVAMYMQTGYVKTDETSDVVTVYRVNKVEISLPSVVIAQPGDVPPASSGNGTLTL